MRIRTTVAALCLLPLSPAAIAHGFAQRYDLPVPLGLYITGAAAAVALSFVVIALFLHGRRTVPDYPRLELTRALASRWIVGAMRAFSVAFLGLVIVAGFIGDENPYHNIAPTAVWVVWWVGLAYVCGLVGNLWAVLNPWNATWRWLEAGYAAVTGGRRPGLGVPWPDWLGCWPALMLFVWFVWAELVWPESDTPARLARAALGYSLVTWAGMFLFGRHAWLRGGEAFSVAFGILARFAPTETRVTDPAVCRACGAPTCAGGSGDCVDCLECFERAPAEARGIYLRPWAVGLLTDRPLAVSTMAFVLVMLASVTFDGLLATPVWATTAEAMIRSQDLRPLIIALQDVTGNAVAAVATIALFVFLLSFQALYWLFSALMRAVTPAEARRGTSVRRVAELFVLSLVPISLAYHLAHYLSFLLIVGQYMIPLASDPFGFGWDLFGTRLFTVDIGIVGARFVWITSVIAIVAGHIVAVWLAHVMALRTFRQNRAALLSQVPMLFLMVGYTMLSLWILAQPVVEAG